MNYRWHFGRQGDDAMYSMVAPSTDTAPPTDDDKVWSVASQNGRYALPLLAGGVEKVLDAMLPKPTSHPGPMNITVKTLGEAEFKLKVRGTT